MSARAIIAPMSFGDSSLPRINLTYTRPIAGATYDWAINQMPAGPLAQWPSLVGGATLQADGASPVVVGSGKSLALRFDGLSSRMRAAFSVTGPCTVVAVHRFTAPKALDQIWYGISGADGGSLGVDSGMTTVRAAAQGKYLIPKPLAAPDTEWHISVLSMNGADSVLRYGDSETVGDLTGTSALDGMTLGFGGGAAYRTAIEYKRIAVIPNATTPAQRASIVDQMRAEYT